MTASDPLAAPARAEVHRLHPLSLLFRIGVALRQLFLPLLLVIFASGRDDTLYWVAPFVVIGVVHGVFHYITYRYRFDGEEMVVRGGVLFRFERHIPYERIQNIDLKQSIFHRLFRVADVKLETASGSEAEARLQVLDLEAVQRMRARVFAGRAAARLRNGAADGEPGLAEAGATEGDDAPLAGAEPAAHTEPGELLHRLTPSDIAVFGLLSNRGLAIVAAVLGLAHETGFLDDDRFSELEIDPEAIGAGLDWITAVVLGLLGVALMKLLSIAWAVLNLAGFELRRRGDDLQVTAGLLTRHTATIPRRRVQVVSVRAGWLHRLFGYAAVKVDTAGGDQLESSSSTRRWVAPLIRADALPALLTELLPQARTEALDWQPVLPQAARRVVKRWWLLALIVGLLAWLTIGPWWALLAVPALIWGTLDAPRRVAAMGWARDGGLFAVRRGVWGRRVRYVPEAKVQVVRLSASPFDRRWGMARVLTDTAGTAFAVNVGFLDAGVAQALADDLSERASSTDFRW